MVRFLCRELICRIALRPRETKFDGMSERLERFCQYPISLVHLLLVAPVHCDGDVTCVEVGRNLATEKKRLQATFQIELRPHAGRYVALEILGNVLEIGVVPADLLNAFAQRWKDVV